MIRKLLAASGEAPVVIFNRTVATFRATFLGVSAADRAKRAARAIREVLEKGGPGKVTSAKEGQRVGMFIDGELVYVLVAGEHILGGGRLITLARWAVQAIAIVVTLVMADRWITFVLLEFPYTRAWGEQLDEFLVGIVLMVGGNILRAIPDLLIAVVIFLIARAFIGMFRPAFDRIETGSASSHWLDRDTARPTRRLFTVGVWLFAIVMAYPYLPGSNSEAFKGMSVLIGLMVTMGGSSLFGRAAAGLILMHSRTVRVGEYVRIGDQEGTVTELGSFTTKIRTGLGEEVTVPNSVVLGTVTKNYSRTVKGQGFVLDTTGDHRLRHAVAADRRDAGRGGPADPGRARRAGAPRLPDGVQIMSPHYLGDPADAKVVPKAKWYAKPAVPPAGSSTES